MGFPFCEGGSVAEDTREGVVVLDPVVGIDDAVFGGGVADDHLGNARVEDHALAHHAAVGARHQAPILGVGADHVQGSTQHLLSRRVDDGVGLGVDGAAHFVALTPGDVQLVTHAVGQVDAVLAAARGTVVARGQNDVVLDDDGAVPLAQAGATLGHGLGDIEIVVLLGNTRGHTNLRICILWGIILQYIIVSHFREQIKAIG